MTPTQIGRYQIEEPLGTGSMGAVYKAHDPLLDRTVAIKVMNACLLSDPAAREEFMERFQREARAVARLSHPNIVSVYDIGSDEDTGPYIVMEYVPGPSLATILRQTPVLPLSQALDFLEQIGDALEEAHQHQIVHRDVKPGNVFVEARGRVKVGDFGIARLGGSELTELTKGLSPGTPGYLAPEVLQGGTADARADVFALGVIAYLLTTGQRPFSGVNGFAIGQQVLEHQPPAPREVRSEVPAGVSDTIMAALAKSPEERIPTAAAFVAALREAQGNAPGPPAPMPIPVPDVAGTPEVDTGTVHVTDLAAPKRVRTPWMPLVAAGLALLGVVGLVMLVRPSAAQREQGSVPSPAARPSAPTDVTGEVDAPSGTDPVPWNPGSEITEPRKIVDFAPVYPESAKRSRKSGSVILELTINETGYPIHIKVLRGRAPFADAAIAAAGQWRYAPAMRNGRPIAVTMTVTVDFRIGRP